MAGKGYEVNFGKQFVEIYKARAQIAKEKNDPTEIDMTDALLELNKNHYKQTQSGSDEEICHRNLSFQKIRPRFPYNLWAPDILPWMKNKQVN